MSEMVDRVAKALAGRGWEGLEDGDVFCSNPTKYHYRCQAREAIAAMRVPTPAMLEAGPFEPYMDRDVWAKMIDAALSYGSR